MIEEWIVIRLDRSVKGGFERHREGNRAKFNLEEGRRILTQLSDAALPKRDVWRLVHHKTLVEPLDHSDWLVKMDAKNGPGSAAKLLDRTPER